MSRSTNLTNRPRSRSKQPRLLAVLLVGLLAVAAAACGDDSDSEGAGSAGDSDTTSPDDGSANGESAGGGSSATTEGEASPEALDIIIPTTQSDVLAYVAEVEGYFADENLTVTVVDSTPATATSLIVSGGADLAAFAVTAPLAVAAQGEQPSIVYSLGGGGLGGSMIAIDPEIATLDDLKAMEGCKIGTFPPGTTAYGWSAVYNKDHGLGCEIVVLQDAPAQIAALAAGQVHALVGGYSFLKPVIDERGGGFLINTTDDEDVEELLRPDPIEVAYWGMAENLDSKPEALTRFFRALNRAREFVLDSDADDVVAVLQEVEAYATTPEETLRDSLVFSFKAYLPRGGDSGSISEDEWVQQLELLADMEVAGVSESDDRFSFENIVNMSYVEAAIG